jgi:hypothetical protein
MLVKLIVNAGIAVTMRLDWRHEKSNFKVCSNVNFLS